jgi:hypothetical protein
MKYLALTLLLTGLSLQSLFAWGGPGPWANGAYYPGQLDGRYSANVYNNTQDRGDYSEMDTPSGNVVRTDTFETTPGTTNVSSYLTTNGTTTITITNDAGVITSSNAVYTTNIASTIVTNTTASTTNLVTSGAAGVVSGVLGFAITDGVPAPTTGTAGGVANIGTTLQSIGLDNNLNYFVVYVDGDVFAGQTAAGINLGTKRVAGSLWNGTGKSFYERVTNTTFDTNNRPISSSVTLLTVPGASAGGYFNANIKSDKSPFTFKGAGEMSTRSTSQSGVGNATYPFNLDGIKVSDN